MLDYLYCLIRYVPDLERMEPINVGIVLQGDGITRVKFNPHAAKRRLVDTETFRRWKEFFTAEIEGGEHPLFSPKRASPQFLAYLGALCDGPISMSRPLVASFEENLGFSNVHQILFERLVLPIEDAVIPEDSRPTGRFRELETEYQLLQRGMKRHALVPVAPNLRWRPYRQVLNGDFLAIDKVEVARELGRTADELNALVNIESRLRQFLNHEIHERRTRYILIADRMEVPFKDQSKADYDTMRDDIERTVDLVRQFGGEVLRAPEESERLAKKLDDELPRIAA